MMYEKSKAEYDRISRKWPEEARVFTVASLKAVHPLKNRVKAVGDHLSKNSRHSSKPPSHDVNRPVKQGLTMNPEAKRPETHTRGLTKQKRRNPLRLLVLMRLHEHEDDVLRFMVEPLAEFTNNQAERDLRMNKIRTKVSGGFRRLEPAQEFVRIRSLISTAIKEDACPLQTLEMVFAKDNYNYIKLVNPD